MKRFPSLYVLILYICFYATGANGDYLEVRRSTIIKAEPHNGSRIIERVEPGIKLELLAEGRQTNGYCNVNAVSLGQPQALYKRVRRGYVLTQEARLKIPLWVQYEATIDWLTERR